MSKYSNTFGRAPDPEEESEEELRYKWPISENENEGTTKTGNEGEEPKGAGLSVIEARARAEQEAARQSAMGQEALGQTKENVSGEIQPGVNQTIAGQLASKGEAVIGAVGTQQKEEQLKGAEEKRIAGVKAAQMQMVFATGKGTDGEGAGTFATGKERRKAGNHETETEGDSETKEHTKAGFYTARSARKKSPGGKEGQGVSNEKTGGRSGDAGSEVGKLRGGKGFIANGANGSKQTGQEGDGRTSETGSRTSSGTSSGGKGNSDNELLSGNDFYGNTFHSKKSGAGKDTFAKTTESGKDAANSEKSGAGSFFSLASEEVNDKKNFVKGKSRFARSIGNSDGDGGELAIEAVKEGGRMIRDMIVHLVTQIKTAVVLVITMVLGPLAGFIASILSSLIGIIIVVIIVVIIAVIVAILGAVTVVATVIASIINWFNGDLAGSSEMYQYAYQYAEEWVADAKDQSDDYLNTVIMMDGIETSYEMTDLYFETAYLAYLGINEEATYINSDLKLDEDSAESNLSDLFLKNDDNVEAFEEIFNGLFYIEADTKADTLIIHVDSWPYYTLYNHVDDMNTYYMIQAVNKENEVRTDLGMPASPRYLEVNTK